MRDKLWFENSSNRNNRLSPILLVSYLRTLSAHYLDTLGRPVDASSQSKATAEISPHARLRWSWLCRALPPDLLLTARNIGNADDSPFRLNPIVERLLQEGGFAEMHLHLGAAVDFPLLWAHLMHGLAIRELSESSFASPGACFENGNKLAKWTMWAAVTRLVLGEWLFNSLNIRDRSQLLDFSKAAWRRRMDAGTMNDLHCLITELAQGRERTPRIHFSRGRTLYRSLIRPSLFLQNRREERQWLRSRRAPETREEVFENDPLASVVGWRRPSACSPETIFVRAALCFMEAEENSEDFARLFWQVIRIRCLLYRHLVLRPLTPGLQWFVRFFSRISPVRKSLPDTVLMEAAIRQSGGGIGLKSLEVRLGTEESESECLDKIRQVNGVRTRPVATEVGAVFHFSRDRGGGWKQGIPNAYGFDRSYPGIPCDKFLRTRQDVGNPSRFRFARFYLEQRRHAQALVSVLRNFPCALRTVRGVDLCTDEAGVPIWVMAPLIRWVREAGQTASIKLRDQGIGGIPPLRTTVHAGEDFVHLLTGLRRLDDAIRHLGLQEGDRIGHGVALGLNPVTWFNRTGRVVQTQEERLFDLMWEWDCYASRGISVESSRLAYLGSTIARLGRKLFDKSLTPETLIHFAEKLHNEQELKAQGFPEQSKYHIPTELDQKLQDSRRLLQEYLRSPQVWWRGRALETIAFDDVGHELKALNRLQRALRRKVGNLGLTVEVNPSSNLMIAGLGLLDEHPIWRLRPFRPVDDVPPLSVCIGSDDPLTVATTLPHEYQLLFDTMVREGQSHEVALAWLGNAREAGMRARFTLPRSITRYPKKLRPSLFQSQSPVLPP